ncbi:microtubule-associated protein futsch isoform X2 [Ooceraea biroi]|uniref:microtubule-associated protein futsch isoform X2 n=1 Tax=Ooceraea biroi TaxID=2015173 RepID=UPI0005BBA954|nr:microtubule-associated protein futsch isoform X2 [Ooceraea biroi]
MVVGEASIHNIMGGMESTGGVRLHNHKRKLKQRFDIIKKLGQGTYGKVQLGINKETGQEVAIKTIKKCKIETEADLIRIRREIQIMSSVQHPNIIHIYEVFENREKMVLVMEYAAGGELYDYLSERKVLSEQEARRIFRQIATAVFYCHKHKICHRDLKLENILLDQVGNAKIADFGLSNVFDEQRLLNTFCGSPLYASPEIVKGTPYHGPEVDCWSLGVLLYTLVYGAMPFDGSNFKRLVKQISQSDYFEPKKPSPASPLIKDMLTVCPRRRADIEKICTHWWVNEGYEQNCLDIAEELADQTPVRLDLLLSLVPQSASAEKLLVGDQQAGGDVTNSMSSETLVPTRCHSVGSLMELDQNSSDRRIRELLEDEPRSSAAGDAKRKLETTPSMDETAAAYVKRKDKSRRKERSDEREPRAYRSSSRHHSAPIPNAISEEAMEVEPAAIVTVPISKTVDFDKVEGAAACLELIEESKERSPSKERSKTPLVNEHEPSREPTENVQQIYSKYGKSQDLHEKASNKEDKSQQKYIKSPSQSLYDNVGAASESPNKTTNETASSKKSEASESKVPNEHDASVRNEAYLSQDMQQMEPTESDFKKLREKALSLDSELSNEVASAPAKPVERRRSKIFETAEKFNQLASTTESEKPKKIFIPGVNVGGAKRAFERKASLSSITTPPPSKANASKVIIDVPTDKKTEKDEQKPTTGDQEVAAAEEKPDKRDEAKKRAVDIISGAIGKPPVQKKLNGSPPTSPQTPDPKKLGLKIQVAPNDVRSATVSVSTPIETKFASDGKSAAPEASITSTPDTAGTENSQSEEPKMSSKMEITLKSATLPRRKTSKAEITLSGVKPPETIAFKSEVEAKIDAFQPQKLRTQRSEVAFPVAAAMPHANRSSSLEPEGRSKAAPRERIIPIQVETGAEQIQHSPTPPSKPPMSQRTMSQRSGSLSRQSTADSDTDSALGSTVGPEPIRKSPREYIIPIAVEGGGYVTPRSGSLEPESKTSTPTSTNPPRSRFGRPRRMSSLLSDASEDESPFSSLHGHMHRLRSSRPSRQSSEHADSLSSGEDDDDDGFELLTAENLFSTLLSRVRSLTQRLNVDDNRSSGFPSSRLFSRLGSQPSQAFWGLNKPLSSYESYVETRIVTTRLSESQFKHSLSRDADVFSKRDSASTSNPGTPNSPGSYSTPSRDSVFEIGSNTLPRDKVEEVHEGDAEAETATGQIRKEAQESLEQNFTPSLARRLSRQFIEQTRQPIPRSPSVPRDSNRHHQPSPTRETLSLIGSSEVAKRHSTSATSDQTEYRDRSLDRGIRRATSLLEPSKYDRSERHSPRRSISLFDDDDDDRLLPPLPRHIMTLGRKYKESTRSNVGNARRENFHGYRTDKIQEEPGDLDMYSGDCKEDMDNNITENGSMSEGTSISICNSKTNLMDTTATTSSVSARSCETSPTESSSNLGDYGKSVCKADISKSFENRLLAAENLIKESKLKNLTPQRFNPNLSCNYKDTDKCDKEALITSDPSLANSVTSKRRSCIPSLRLRSGSLTREPSASTDRRKSFAGAQDASAGGANQERSILSKFFRSGSSSKEIKAKDNNKSQKPKQHRISRFLRPDFFDTPREESQYVKEKEAQKAAENERRKSRFMRRKSESKERKEDTAKDEKICKEQKNEINALQKDKLDSTTGSPTEDKSKSEEKEKTKIVRQSSKSSFLHSLEKKLERLRSNDESTSTIAKPTMNGNVPGDRKERGARECSAPPVECPTVESTLTEVKRTLSVEDLSLNKSTKSSPSAKAKVTSVLGLFKTNADTKQNANGRSQNAIMSKLKRSPPKCAKSMESPLEEDAAATSKIPTKFTRTDNKSVKKVPESKKSPPKEKSKERELIVKERKPMERQSREFKRAPEKSDSSFADKAKQEKTESLRKSSDDSESLQKVVDNKQAESIANNEDKKLVKTKKNISSLDKNGSVTRIDKGADVDKKIKKPVIPKEETDKEEINGAKKKRIVRVVKKVVKKSSDSSESKSEEKEKSRPLMKKKIVTTRKEKSPEGPTGTAQNSVKGNNVDNQTATRSSHLKQTQPNVQEISSAKSSDAAEPSVQNTITMPKPDAVLNSSNANVSAANLSQTASALQNTSSPQNCASSVVQNVSNSILATSAASITQNASNFNINQAKPPEQHRANRASLKLDLSKIPQHTFRHATPKRESPKSESPKANSAVSIGSPKTDAPAVESSSDKLMDCLSKMTHHANITGNKIIIDKPLRAKDVAELKREVTECAKIIENHVELQNDCSTSQNIDKVIDSGKPIADERSKEIAMNPPKETSEVVKEPTLDDCTSEMFSPEEPESFDSWSICSADLNHNRSDLHSPQLHSPTSPSYSLFMRGDSSESVIDRIRRRSFYSRFNDRKRPSLTAPPPGISSVTLPRRFSFNSSRERERSRLYNYGVPRTRSDKSYLYGDEVSCRKSPVDRERYSDTLNTSSYGHHSPEARSIFDHYGNSVPSTSHDSLRRYVRSPTLDLVTSRAKYHSSDIIADNDLTGSYKSPLSRSMLNESMTDSYCGRSTSSTLPRKFGSTVGNLEPKSVEYYEEILSPSNADYLSPRDTCRSPLLDGYLSRCENGYHHNGNLDLPQFDKQKSYTNKMTDVELGEGNSRLGEQKRNIMRRLSETRDTPSTTADILSNLSVTEQD